MEESSTESSSSDDEEEEEEDVTPEPSYHQRLAHVGVDIPEEDQISTRPKILNIIHTHIPLIKNFFCLPQNS